MKRMLVMLEWMNSGGTRQPKRNGCQALLAAALILLLSVPGAWAVPLLPAIPSNGPAVGGNVVVVTNISFAIGNGSDITNVVFSNSTQVASSTNIPAQGTNWVQVVAPAHAAGLVYISIQSTSEATHLVSAYTFNPAGQIGNEIYWSWINLGDGLDSTVLALALGTNGALYAGGDFDSAGGVDATNVAMWNGTTWTNLGLGLSRPVATAYALASDTNGSLYAAGDFTIAGGVEAMKIAKWNGTSWTNLGGGLSTECEWAFVKALALDTNGNLYAGGDFRQAGDVTATNVAMWNGTTWTNLGLGLSAPVDTTYALALDTNGNLYAGGDFTIAGEVTANRIAKWNGTIWTNLGAGLNGTVCALALGANGELYAGGSFTNAGGVAATNVAMWNGTTWTNLGVGMYDGDGGNDACVYALAVGTNGELYAGGHFTQAGGVAATNIAKWNGTTWTNLGDGVDTIVDAAFALALDTNGNLYAGGSFTTAGGVPANYIAKWFETPANFGVSPSNGNYAGGYTVTITGTNLGNGSDITNVTLVYSTVARIVTQSPTQVVVIADEAAVPGLGDVSVYSTSYGKTVKSNAFTYTTACMMILGTNGAPISDDGLADITNGSAYGMQNVGTSVTRTFGITNGGDGVLNVYGWTTNGTGAAGFSVACVPATLAIGGSSNFTVTFNPASFGGYDAKIIFTNNSWGQFFRFRVSGSGAITNLPTPVIISATYGTYTNMVRVTWNGVAGATSYKLYRSQTNNPAAATLLADIPANQSVRDQKSEVGGQSTAYSLQSTVYIYDDTTVVARRSYYYWVRALSSSGVSALSYVGMGYAELGSGQTVGRADLTVSDMVFLPVNLTNGSPAGTVSYRLANGGPDALTAAPVRFDFYMVQGGQEAWMAFNETNVTLAVGAEQLRILDASARQGMRVRGDLAGQYTVQTRARHLDLMGDQHTGSNMTDAAGTVLVRATGMNSPGRSLNDYDSDGKSDVCVYQSVLGRWYLKLSGDRYGADPMVGDFGMGWTPVAGDYDGDGITDVAVYERSSGQWLVRYTSSGLWGECWLGGPAFTAAQCDFDGDAMTDPMAYREADGYWLGAASSRQYALGDAFLGETGYQSVIADYDGDGLADPAVYNRITGLWAIGCSSIGYQLVTGMFGGSGYLPASADYDGDGLADPAIYAPATADWQVLLSASLAAQGVYTWWDGVVGNIGGIPVPADYDGDGKADFAVYHPDTSRWELFPSAQGYQLVWGLFGGLEYQPVVE